MKAKLIGYTKATGPMRRKGIYFPDEFIAYCARVSNPSNQFNSKTGNRLVQYLIKNKHWSPLEMVSATMEIETTRDIARQLLRHRSFSFQEFSQRYADPEDLETSFVVREARLQDPKNRQNSIVTDDKELHMAWIMKQEQIIHEAKMAYKWAIEQGIAKEQARCVLPEGNTVSKVIVNGTLRSWVHYVDLRSAEGTQEEHRDLAIEIADVISTIFTPIKDYNHGQTY